MKSFFQRKNEPQPGPSKESYKIWMPKPELPVPERTDRREGRSSSRMPSEKPRSSSRTPRPADTLATASKSHKYSTSAPAVTYSQSQHVPQAYPGLSPSYVNVPPSPRPSVRTANLAKTYASSSTNAVYSTSARPETAKASSSHSRRERETNDKYADRARDRSERERLRERDTDRAMEKERTRDRDRDRERVRERDRDRGRDRDRDREREKDRERPRDRDRERTKRSDPYAEPVATVERILERDGQRGTNNTSSRDKDRTRTRERGPERMPVLDSGREKLTKDAERHRESSRRPSDYDKEHRSDSDRIRRRMERERESVPTFPKLGGRDSSDEGESSDASRHKHGMTSSAHRRTKVKDPTTAWPVTGAPSQSGFPSSSRLNHDGALLSSKSNHSATFHGTAFSSKSPQEYSESSRTYQDPAFYTGYSAPLMPKPAHDSGNTISKFNQDTTRILSPEPLPVPLRIPEGFRQSPSSQYPPDNPSTIPNSDDNVLKRPEWYDSSSSKARDKEPNISSTLRIPPVQNPMSLEETGALPATMERTTDSSPTQGIGQATSVMYPTKDKAIELPEKTSSRHDRATYSNRHRHTEQSTAGTSAHRESRSHKVSSASQQATPAVSASASTHNSRRERDKGSKHHSSKDSRSRQDANTTVNPPTQIPDTSLLFQGSQTTHLPMSTSNNSPQTSISFKFTPPTPIKRSPSVLDEQLAINPNNLSSVHPFAPPSFGTPKVSKASEYALSPSVQTMQPERELSEEPSKAPESKVEHIMANYEPRSSLTREKSILNSTPPTVSQYDQSLPQNKTGTPLGTSQTSVSADHSPAAHFNSSPSFNVAVSSNGRGRTVSISASNEAGSPYKNSSVGSYTGPHLTTALPPNAADNPSSKKSTHVPFTPQPPPLANPLLSNPPLINGYQSSPAHNRIREDYGDPDANKHTMHGPVSSELPTRSSELGNDSAWPPSSQSQPSPLHANEAKDHHSRNGTNRKISRSGESKAPDSQTLWSTPTDRIQNGSTHIGQNDQYRLQGSSGTYMNGTSLSSPTNPTTMANGSGLSSHKIAVPEVARTDRAAFPNSFAQEVASYPPPSSRQKTVNMSKLNGSTLPPQHTSLSTAPPPDTDAVTRGTLSSNQAEPLERVGSAVPFRHPKLAELMSDTASPPRPHGPEPVIQPLGADILPTVTTPSSVKQDDWMLPTPSKWSSPAAAGFSHLYTSPAHFDPQTDMGHIRKNFDTGASFAASTVLPSDSNNHSASSGPSKTMAYARADTAKQSGENYATSRMRVTSQPESSVVPPRPPSTRPTETWSSNAPMQYSTYPANEQTGSRRRARSKIPESEAFMHPVQPQTVGTSFKTSYPDTSGIPPVTSSPHDDAHRHRSRPPSEESILKTPSSLTTSVLKPTTSRTSTSSQQESRKKGFLGMFKSKNSSSQSETTMENSHETSSQDENIDRGKADMAAGLTDTKPADGKLSFSKSLFRSKIPSSQPQTATGNPYEVWTPPVLRDLDSNRATADVKPSDTKPSISRSKIPPPITVPISIPPITERKSPNHKVFTPFRYLTSKRNRTVSSASAEAVDGTAPNTVVGSPTASMHSSQPPIQPPPLRDSQQATHEWRERKDSETRNNRYRVQRPGVVFDVPHDMYQDKQNLRYAKMSRNARPSA